jgi:hypothetical protein
MILASDFGSPANWIILIGAVGAFAAAVFARWWRPWKTEERSVTGEHVALLRRIAGPRIVRRDRLTEEELDMVRDMQRCGLVTVTRTFVCMTAAGRKKARG